MDENWDLIGHEWAVQLLKGHLKRGTPRHAYLFTGSQGIGRRTLALRYAQAFNAEQDRNDGDFDPKSRTSQQIAQMRHPDLSLVERQKGDNVIKIDAIRQLQHSLSLSPYAARYRVALLLDFEMANDNAANALLKTLEEPPARVVLLLTAENTEALLPTITSRCEVIRLRPVPLDQLASHLQQQYKLSPDHAQLLAHVSGGRPGHAIQLQQQPELLSQRNTWLDEHRQLLSSNRIARFDYAKKMIKDKGEFIQMLHVWLSFWRDVLLQTSQSGAPLANINRREEIDQLANNIETEVACSVLKNIENTLQTMQTNANLRLVAENLLLEIPYI